MKKKKGSADKAAPKRSRKRAALLPAPPEPVEPLAIPELDGLVEEAFAPPPLELTPPPPAIAAVIPAPAPAPEPVIPASDPDSGDERLVRRSLRELVALRDGAAECLLFRIGAELFAAELAAVEEAIEIPAVHHLPEMPDVMMGVFELRGRMVPVYSPSHALRVKLASNAAAVIVLNAQGRRVGLAIDDVEDVITLTHSQVRRPPVPDNDDNVLVGVLRRGRDLVSLVDADALVAACLSDQITEAV